MGANNSPPKRRIRFSWEGLNDMSHPFIAWVGHYLCFHIGQAIRSGLVRRSGEYWAGVGVGAVLYHFTERG